MISILFMDDLPINKWSYSFAFVHFKHLIGLIVLVFFYLVIVYLEQVVSKSHKNGEFE
jgi:hypothetical protein